MPIHLIPHQAKPCYELLVVPPTPSVTIGQDALLRMRHYVDIAKGEVGWLGTVHVTAATETSGAHYFIDAVYLFDQQVHATTTEIDAESIAEIANDFLIEDGYNPELRVNRLKLWGHSHVEMDTAPSGQDNAQMAIWANSGARYMLRLIANKKGRVVVDVYDYANNMIWTDVPWTMEEVDTVGEAIRLEMQAKVRPIPPAPIKPRAPYAGLDRTRQFAAHDAPLLGRDRFYDRTPTERELAGDLFDRNAPFEDGDDEFEGDYDEHGRLIGSDFGRFDPDTGLDRDLNFLPQDFPKDLKPGQAGTTVRPLPGKHKKRR